jgi:hypothetical protein
VWFRLLQLGVIVGKESEAIAGRRECCMHRAGIRSAVAFVLLALGMAALPSMSAAEWSIETVPAGANGREAARARLAEFGGSATLLIQCSTHGADPLLYVHGALSGTHIAVTFRFDEDDAHTRMAALSHSGHVLQIWSEEGKQAFARARRLRVQLRPFVVFDFDLRGIETVASKLRCA